jgi:hypothetical protein
MMMMKRESLKSARPGSAAAAKLRLPDVKRETRI